MWRNPHCVQLRGLLCSLYGMLYVRGYSAHLEKRDFCDSFLAFQKGVLTYCNSHRCILMTAVNSNLLLFTESDCKTFLVSGEASLNSWCSDHTILCIFPGKQACLLTRWLTAPFTPTCLGGFMTERFFVWCRTAHSWTATSDRHECFFPCVLHNSVITP